MTAQLPSVAIVMLTCNQRATTLRALESIEPIHQARVTVVLWDNGSTDDTASAVQAAFPLVLVHHSPGNLGVAGGRNAGAALAIERVDPDFLCFLDNDLVLASGFVDALVAVLLERPDAGQVQAKLRYLDRPDILQDGGGCEITFWLGRTRPIGDGEVDRGQRDRMVECVAGGGAMIVRASLFQELGGFDEAFNPFGPEDIDFSLRLRRSGHLALFVPAALAWHAVSHSFEPGGYTPTYARVKARHWIRFIRRHASPLQQAAFFLAGMPLLALKLLVREGRRGNLGALVGSVRGMLTGFRQGR
jgi:GT2 family glycosyltransferase